MRDPVLPRWLLPAVLLILIVIHQDFWFWTDKTLVFGALPIGLAYHILYSVLASLAMWMMVRSAWPEHLERQAESAGHPSEEGR